MEIGGEVFGFNFLDSSLHHIFAAWPLLVKQKGKTSGTQAQQHIYLLNTASGDDHTKIIIGLQWLICSH